MYHEIVWIYGIELSNFFKLQWNNLLLDSCLFLGFLGSFYVEGLIFEPVSMEGEKLQRHVSYNSKLALLN